MRMQHCTVTSGKWPSRKFNEIENKWENILRNSLANPCPVPCPISLHTQGRMHLKGDLCGKRFRFIIIIAGGQVKRTLKMKRDELKASAIHAHTSHTGAERTQQMDKLACNHKAIPPFLFAPRLRPTRTHMCTLDLDFIALS